MTEIELKLDNHIQAKINEDGVSQYKVLSYEQLSQLFQQTERYDSGMLPGEYYLQRLIKQPNSTFYLYTEPARVITLEYSLMSYYDEVDRDDYYDEDGDFDEDAYEEAVDEYRQEHQLDNDNKYQFTVPITVWMVERNERGDLRDSRMFSLKSPIYTGNEKLFYAPFTNIYTSSYGRPHSVCWGDNTVNLPTVKAIQGLSNTFFSAPANMDLSNGRVNEFRRSKFENTRGFNPLHLHMETDKRLKDGESPAEVLEFTHTTLKPTEQTVMTAFERFSKGQEL